MVAPSGQRIVARRAEIQAELAKEPAVDVLARAALIVRSDPLDAALDRFLLRPGNGSVFRELLLDRGHLPCDRGELCIQQPLNIGQPGFLSRDILEDVLVGRQEGVTGQAHLLDRSGQLLLKCEQAGIPGCRPGGLYVAAVDGG